MSDSVKIKALVQRIGAEIKTLRNGKADVDETGKLAAANIPEYLTPAAQSAAVAQQLGDVADPSNVAQVIIDAAILAHVASTDPHPQYLTRSPDADLTHTGFAWYEQGADAPDTYQSVSRDGTDTGLLAGNTDYTRQVTGTPALHAVQSRMRRCVVKDDGTGVRYYLDADNSAKIAGTYANGVQTGWVRVYEGALDPAKTTPGQTPTPNAALRDRIAPWGPTVTYNRGDRVLHNGSLWDSLSDGNLNIVPAAGTTNGVLSGGDGQVMVEIPAFYYRSEYDPSRRRHTYEVVFDRHSYVPFPDLTTEGELAPSVLLSGREFALHPTFLKAGKQRRARYRSAFHASATNPGNNGTGVLRSIADGATINAVNIANTNFRTKARNRNTGLVDLSGAANDVWALEDYWMLHAVQLLLFTEYRTFYSQAVVGGGNISGSDYTKVTGRSSPMGNASGVFDDAGAAQAPSTGGDFSGMTWRGIEDLWGTAWRWMDGWNIRNGAVATEHYVANTPGGYDYSTLAAPYAKLADSPKSNDSWAYPAALLADTFLPSAFGANTVAGLTDGYYSNADTSGGWQVARVGGYADIGGRAGAAVLAASLGAGVAHVYSGAALIL